MENAIDLAGKNVLVTGGNGGIGSDICRTMAACGANVIINYFADKGRAQILAAELQREYGVKAYCFEADVADPEAVERMFVFMDDTLGSIDILVNNAGIETIDHAITLSLDDWDRIFNVNLKGAFVCAQQAGVRMVGQRSGVILNISSIHDSVPRKGLVHYCASKAGLNMMTKCLALELAEYNVRVIAVSPGAIETEMNKGEIANFGREKFNQFIPAGRVGHAAEVGWTCCFLASGKAAYITATEIYLDGGYKENTIRYDPRPQKK